MTSVPKKLRILCLHGYNNKGEIMMFQMQNFINTFSDICEFSFLDGPHDVKGQEPISYFVERGIAAPFKHWSDFLHKIDEVYKRTADGSLEL